MTIEEHREWLPRGWPPYRKIIMNFLNEYESMKDLPEESRRERFSKGMKIDKKYMPMIRELQTIIQVIWDMTPEPMMDYKNLAKILHKEFEKDRAIKELGNAILFMGYQMVQDRGQFELLYQEIANEGKPERLKELIEKVEEEAGITS